MSFLCFGTAQLGLLGLFWRFLAGLVCFVGVFDLVDGLGVVLCKSY